MNGAPQDVGTFNNILAGLWAFVGTVARGTSDWKDPQSGKFSIALFVTSIAAAILLGEVAVAMTIYFGINPVLQGALAGLLGYLGPAPVMEIAKNIFPKIFGDKHDGDGNGKSGN